MSKGSSSPAGQTNVTNPAQVAQQPYLNYGYEQAKEQYQNTPYYPGTTVARYYNPNPLQTQGYQNLASTGQDTNQYLRSPANTAFVQAVSGGMGNAANPATPYYQGYAEGTSPVSQNYQGLQQAAQQGGQNYAQAVGQYAPQQAAIGEGALNAGTGYANQIGQYANPMAGLGAQAAANSNLGLSQLGRAASGEYLNSNPYMAQMVQSAMDPVTRNYQTAIAPGLDAAAAASGRYGSGAQANQASTAQQNLTRGLSDLSGNLYGQQYARERQAQDAAAQNYGQLYNAGLGLGMQGLQNAAGIQNQAGNMYMAGAGQAQTGLSNAANTQAAAGGQFWRGQDAASQMAQQQAAANQYGITGLGSGFNQGNQNTLEAMRQFPQLAQAQATGAQQQITGGQGLSAQDQQYRQYEQQKIDEDMARYNYPQQQLKNYMEMIGGPQAGSTSTPYYRNQGAEIMSGISGIAGIAGQVAPMLGKI